MLLVGSLVGLVVLVVLAFGLRWLGDTLNVW